MDSDIMMSPENDRDENEISLNKIDEDELFNKRQEL
jgi:hypothetical protein